MLPCTTLAGIGCRYDNPHVGRCGIACRWAARCDQHKELQPSMGAQSWSTTKSRLSFPGRGLLNVVWVPFVVLCWFIWPELRCWGFRNNLVWPRLEDVVELVYMGCPLSVIRGLVHSLPCSRVALIGRKTVRMWLFLCKNRMVLDYEMGSQAEASAPSGEGGWPWRIQESAWKLSRESTPGSSSPSRRMRRVRAARKFLGTHLCNLCVEHKVACTHVLRDRPDDSHGVG